MSARPSLPLSIAFMALAALLVSAAFYPVIGVAGAILA